MSSALLILLARAVHILGGVFWAGSVFVMASVILPLAAKQGNEGFGQWVRPIGRKVGPAAGIASLVTIGANPGTPLPTDAVQFTDAVALGLSSGRGPGFLLFQSQRNENAGGTGR